MQRLRDRLRSRSPGPRPSAKESSRHSDALAAVNKVLDIAEKAVDGLPIHGLKQVIFTIHAILQTVEVKVTDYLSLDGDYLPRSGFFLEIKS